ncbi:MAG: hypothetical protein R2785_09210 [Flavobacteriaceae bacterium]
MKSLKPTIKYLIISMILISCNGGIKNGTELTQSDLNYIEEIGLKDDEEKVILFDSQMDNKTSGNLITNKRLASYWIDKEKNINKTNFAYYSEIDTLLTKDLSKSLTYASFIKVIKNDKTEFKVFVDDNEKNTKYFFEKAITEWEKWRK